MASIPASSVPAAALFLSSTLSLVLLWILCSKRQKVQAQPSKQQEEPGAEHTIEQQLVHLEQGASQATSLPQTPAVAAAFCEPNNTITPLPSVMESDTGPGTLSPRATMANSGSQTLPAPRDDDTATGATKSLATESVIYYTKELHSNWYLQCNNRGFALLTSPRQ